MPTLKLRKTVSGFGPQLQELANRTGSGGNQRTATIAKGKAGTLSTRTNNTSGTLTLGVSHGIITAQVVDIYWSGGHRYNVNVGSVSGLSVPISGGVGSNLPVQGTAIICSPQTTLSVGVPDTEDILLLGAKMTYLTSAATSLNANLQLVEDSPSSIAVFDLEPNVGFIRDLDGGEENDLGGAIVDVVISNPSTTQTGTFNMVWVTD